MFKYNKTHWRNRTNLTVFWSLIISIIIYAEYQLGHWKPGEHFGIQIFTSISGVFVVCENHCSPEQLQWTELGSNPVMIWSIELHWHFLEFCPLSYIRKGTCTAVSPVHWGYLLLNCPLEICSFPLCPHFTSWSFWLAERDSHCFSSQFESNELDSMNPMVQRRVKNHVS